MFNWSNSVNIIQIIRDFVLLLLVIWYIDIVGSFVFWSIFHIYYYIYSLCTGK